MILAIGTFMFVLRPPTATQSNVINQSPPKKQYFHTQILADLANVVANGVIFRPHRINNSRAQDIHQSVYGTDR